jgi:hypothetical protein
MIGMRKRIIVGYKLMKLGKAISENLLLIVLSRRYE